MTGTRLVIGAVVMALVVPAALFFLLSLQTFGQFFTLSATCFLAWGVADLTATILSRPRLGGRSPGGAIRDWRSQREKETADEAVPHSD